MELPELRTARLVLRPAQRADAPAVTRFYEENREHLTPWWPAWAPDFFTVTYQEERIAAGLELQARGAAVRFTLFDPADSGRMLGLIHFNNVTRGCGHYADLGYGLDRDAQGKGLMAEGLRAAIGAMFEVQRLHRIQANYLPHNRRSGSLLRRLGFTVEGYARDFLLINGAWEDHVLTSLTNPDWRPPAAP